MAAILPKDRKLDFLIFDACFMSCVEVAYDLRHAAQYIIASPTEIMGDGFPYGTVAPLFFRETLDPQAICSAFVDHYRNLTTPENGGSASIALIKTSEMDALASAARDVFALNPAPVVDAGSVQYLELLPNHVFYDLEDYLSQFASGTSQFEAFQRQLAKRWSIRIIRTGFTAHLACITALTPSRVPVFAGSPPIFHVRISRAITLLTCKPLGLRQ